MTIVTPVFFLFFSDSFQRSSSQEEMWAGFSSEDRVGGMTKVDALHDEAVEGRKMNRKIFISVIQPRKTYLFPQRV